MPRTLIPLRPNLGVLHMMHKRFQMSSMGELTFFLGLQVKQKEDGIFITQDKKECSIYRQENPTFPGGGPGATIEKGDNSNKVLKKRDPEDDQDEDASTRSNRESVEEPVFEIALDNIEQTLDDKVGDAGQPPHTEETQADNTVKTIDDSPEQPWFNEMIQAEKPPLIFDELMSTPIDFLAFAMNRLKLNKIIRADLVGLVFNLLKGTNKSCVELEYNIEECYRALTDQLDWANPKGHKSPVDMSKPLPLKDKEVRLTILIEFFFNNDLEYLKARKKERSYSSSITKTPAASDTLEGI
ncbi:hypothetical protein Tco_1273785 [Tanacetum coccineum]